MSKADAAANQAGFTLLELVVSIALLGMLTVALYSATSFGASVWRKEVGVTSELTQVRTAQVLIRDLLSRVYPLIVRSGESDVRADFSGTPTSIGFLTPAQADIAPGGLARVTLRLDRDMSGGSLAYLVHPELAVNEKAASRTLLRRVKALTFSYFGSDDGKEPGRWSSTWDRRSHLPDLIRVQLVLESRSAPNWPDLVIRPRLTADAGCTFDPLIKRCRGY